MIVKIPEMAHVSLDSTPMKYALRGNAGLLTTPFFSSTMNLDAKIWYYKASLQFGLKNLAKMCEEEFLRLGLPEYIIPRYLFTDLNAGFFAMPLAVEVSRTTAATVPEFLNFCSTKYSPASFGWLIGYMYAICLGKDVVAAQIAKEIKKYSTVSACVPYFLELCMKNSDVTSRLATIVTKLNDTGLVEQAKIQEDITVQEDIEKHDELNPALFENNKLKPEVREKAIEVADELLKMMEECGLSVKLKDIVITGSNASYNYTKDSDVDLHLVADMTGIDDSAGLYPILFNSFKSAFNRKYQVEFFGVPVEVYIESADTAVVSNGIYSVQNDEWVQEPKNEEIPDVDLDELAKAVEPWKARYEQLVADIEAGKLETEDPIDEFVDELYKMRSEGLYGKNGSEYSTENLVFKEIRNMGGLDKLKELKDQVISSRLSLEEQLMNPATRERLRVKIQQLAFYQPIIQTNGIFEIHNIPESEAARIVNVLRAQKFIAYAQVSSGAFDFSRLGPGGIPSRKCTIHGKLTNY